VLHQVGAGTLGPVFRAYDPDRDRLVAIKLFRLDLPPERVHQLVAEFDHLIDTALDHPVVAAPLAAGIEGVNAYLVQEYVAAESLDIVIREGGPAPVADAMSVLSRLAGALDYAGDRHVVHGTLHPRDVLLSPEDFRLVGLGVARALERIGVPAPIRRPYTAPERIGGGAWDRRADVFGLAAVIYELVWGRRLSGSGAQAAVAIPESSEGNVAALRDTFARALADDMSERFATASAFAEALDAAFAGRPAKVSRMVRRTAPRPAAEPLLPLDEDASPDLMLRRPEPSATPTSSLSSTPLRSAERAAEETEERKEAGRAADDPAFDTVVHLDSRRELRSPADGNDEIEATAREPIEVVLARSPQPEVVEPVEPAANDRVAPGDFLGLRGAARLEEEPRETAKLVASAADPEVDPRVTAAGSFSGVDAADASTASLVWPLVLAGIVGVALGFGAGYAVAIRDRPVVLAGAPPAAETPAPETAPAPAAHEFGGGNVESRPLPPPTASPAPPSAGAAAPARPAPAVPLFAGRVLVRSTPPGARVFVDGKSGGETPATVRDLARGPHQVRIVHEGYTTVERRITITAAQPAVTLMVPMVKTPAAAAAARTEAPLVVESKPAGASVFLDGRAVGTTPLTFPLVTVGTHSIRLTLDGYRPWTGSVEVSGSEANRVTASLER
jgi:serine/threonine protein kinase